MASQARLFIKTMLLFCIVDSFSYLLSPTAGSLTFRFNLVIVTVSSESKSVRVERITHSRLSNSTEAKNPMTAIFRRRFPTLTLFSLMTLP